MNEDERRTLRFAIDRERRARLSRRLAEAREDGPRCPGVSGAGRACQNKPRFPAESPRFCGVHRGLIG